VIDVAYVGALLTLTTMEPKAFPNAAESITAPLDWPVISADARLTLDEFTVYVTYPSTLNWTPLDITINEWMLACSYTDVQWIFLSATTGVTPDGECTKLKRMLVVTSTTVNVTDAFCDTALGNCGKLTVTETVPKLEVPSTNKFSVDTCATTPLLCDDTARTVRGSALMSLVDPSEKYSITVKAVLLG